MKAPTFASQHLGGVQWQLAWNFFCELWWSDWWVVMDEVYSVQHKCRKISEKISKFDHAYQRQADALFWLDTTVKKNSHHSNSAYLTVEALSSRLC